MTALDVTLGLPPEIIDGLGLGTLVRDGGVVREASTGRLVALLRDADVADSPLRGLLESNVVPFALVGISMARLERALARVEDQVRRGFAALSAQVALVDQRVEAAVAGEFLGNFQACALDLESGRVERLPEYRRLMLVSAHQFRLLVRGAVTDVRVLRASPGAVGAAVRAALVAGVAARELTFRLGERDAALGLTDVLARDWGDVHERARDALGRPASLFWIEPVHRALERELRESAHRLEAHREMARLLPASGVLERQRRYQTGPNRVRVHRR